MLQRGVCVFKSIVVWPLGFWACNAPPPPPPKEKTNIPGPARALPEKPVLKCLNAVVVD